MATEDNEKTPKRSGLGWIPKLSLWAVVIAFGYLYLSSVERGTAEQDAQVSAAEASVTETNAESSMGFKHLVDKVSGLTTTAGDYLSDVTETASGYLADATEGVKQAVDKLKGFGASDAEAPAETATAEATTAPSAVAETAETAPAESAMIEAPAADTAPALAESPAEPAALPARVTQGAGFDRHYAPLPAQVTPRTGAETTEAAPAVTAVEELARGAEPAPVEQAETAVFAESVMRETPTAAPAPEATPPTAVESPAVAREPVLAPETASRVPLIPQPRFREDAAAPPSAPWPAGQAELERQQAAIAEYQARMQAEYENRRRAAEAQARAYWESMQNAAPAAAYPGYGAPQYAPGYTPGYAPGYVPYGYPR